MYKGEDGVGSALILRLRQNRPPTAVAVHSTPGAGWGRSRAGLRLVATGGCRALPRPGHNQAAEAVAICRGQAAVRPQCHRVGAGSAVRETGVW